MKRVCAALLLAVVACSQAFATFASFQTANTTISPAITLDFAAGTASGTCASIAACLSNTNSTGGYVQNADGTWTLISANTIRRGTNGLLSEPPGANATSNSRDLTNAAWTKTNVTAAKTATGIDGSANVASNLTATAANGTVCQAVTTATGKSISVFVKRVTGTGEIDLSINNGTNWWAVDATGIAIMGVQRALDSIYQQVQLLGAGTNPTVCIRIVTNGDAVALDYFELQSPSSFSPAYAQYMTSPMVNGSSRSQDIYTPTGNLLSALRTTSTVVVTLAGMDNVRAVNVFNGGNTVDPTPTGGKTNSSVGVLLDPTNNHALGTTGASPGQMNPFLSGSSVATTYAPGNDFNNTGLNATPRTSPIGAGGWTYPSKVCWSVDGSGSSYTFSGGTVQTAATFSLSVAITMFNNMAGYVQKIDVYNTRLSNAAMLSACYVAPLQPTLPDAAVSGTNYYLDYSAGKEQTLTAANSNNYGAETGQLGAPGGTSSGSYPYIRGYVAGTMQQVSILPGDPPGFGIISFSVSERTEINGGYTAGPGAVGTLYANGATLWLSYSFLWEPGLPNLAHDFMVIMQSHASVGPGLSLLAAMGNQGKPDTFAWTNDANNLGATYANLTVRRACWYNVVQQIVYQNSATGTWNVWINGTQVVSQSANISNSESGGVGNYFKLGIYRAWSAEMQAIFYANVVQSTSSLNAKIASPDAIPAGFTYSGAPICSVP